MPLRVNLVLFSALVASCSASTSDSDVTSCADADVSLLQTSVHMSVEKSVQMSVAPGHSQDAKPECVALEAATASYRLKPVNPAMEGGYNQAGEAAAEELEKLGWSFVEGWNASSVPGDFDYMGLWHKGCSCMVTFMGSDHELGDFVNNFNDTLVEQWGISGVHAGIVAELEPLVKLVDFSKMKQTCTGTIAVAGHSLGGGMAQLFALAINSPADPLGAELKVDSLYTFGPMAVTSEKEANPNAADGCFPGGLYVTSTTSPKGDFLVDVVKTEYHYGNDLVPVKTKKVVLHSPGDATTYDCGTLLPDKVKEFPLNDPNGPGGLSVAWLTMHHPASYKVYMAC